MVAFSRKEIEDSLGSERALGVVGDFYDLLEDSFFPVARMSNMRYLPSLHVVVMCSLDSGFQGDPASAFYHSGDSGDARWHPRQCECMCHNCVNLLEVLRRVLKVFKDERASGARLRACMVPLALVKFLSDMAGHITSHTSMNITCGWSLHHDILPAPGYSPAKFCSLFNAIWRMPDGDMG